MPLHESQCDLFSGGFWDFLKHTSLWAGGPHPINLTKQKFRRSGSLKCLRILTVTWSLFSFLLHFPFKICSSSLQEAALFWCHTLPMLSILLLRQILSQMISPAGKERGMRISLSVPLNLLAGGWHTMRTTTATTKRNFARTRNFWADSELEIKFCIGFYFGEGK